MKDFELWLEFEEVKQPEDWNKENDLANIHLDMKDGRQYGINIWTFDCLKTLVEIDKKDNSDGQGIYIKPPDLFVKELTRECVEKAISELLKEGNLEEVLNNSIFGLKFLEPWIDMIEFEESSEVFENELRKEIHEAHPLWAKSFKAIAKRQDNDDVLVELEDGQLAVVHLTWSGKSESDIFPRTKTYLNKKDFWKRRLQHDIAEFVE